MTMTLPATHTPESTQRVSETVPRPEYPRPQLDRSKHWQTLNGTWFFTRDSSETAEQIAVPFAWETQASGIEAHWLDRATYRRHFEVDAEWSGKRTVLHFGAVHHEATVSVDGTVVGTHVGGSVPFEFDITDALGADTDHEVVVEVFAPLDKRGIVHGKQRSIPRDDYDSCAFTPSSGIWQPVWLEARPSTYLASLLVLPTDDLTGFRVSGLIAGPSTADATVTISIDSPDAGGRVATAAFTAEEVSAGQVMVVPDPRLWSPANPHLYSVRVDVASPDGTDTVASSTGLRRIETRGNDIYLNGQRISLRGVLDQGYWPQSGMTAPTDNAFVVDLQIAREAGFNLVRKHLKLEDPRFYFHADRLGMLVWAEPASTGRFSPKAAEAFAAQVQPMVESFGSHPSIIVWGLYNEEWGLDWALPEDPAKQSAVRDVFYTLKALDSTRPVVDNSGWTHLETDLVDWHVYDEHPAGWAKKVRDLVEDDDPTFPVAIAVDVIVDKVLMIGRSVPRDVPFVNSEFGGGWTSIDRGWNLHWQTQELRRHNSIAGWVWTELNDIEHESAGIVDTARIWKDNGGRPPRHVNGETTPVFQLTPEAPGRDLVTADGRVAFAAAVSHHGAVALGIDVSVAWGATFSLEPSTAETLVGHVDVAPFIVSETVDVESSLPATWSSGRAHIILRSRGAKVGRGAIDIVRA